MAIVRAFVCLVAAAAMSSIGCSSSDANAGGDDDASAPHDGSPSDGATTDTASADTAATDAADTRASDGETGSCTGWDADWGDAPKPDVMSPCRSSCDCADGYHCCSSAGGPTCAPAFECP